MLEEKFISNTNGVLKEISDRGDVATAIIQKTTDRQLEVKVNTSTEMRKVAAAKRMKLSQRK